MKYELTLKIIVLSDSNEDAIQKGLNIARNERKQFDNQCRLDQVERIDGISLTDIEFDKLQNNL